MRVEYEAIAAAGLILQIDDAWLPALWDRIGMAMGLAAFRARCAMRIEALNHALRNMPEDRVRYHLCWGSWHGLHAFDLELERIVDIVLKVKAQAFLIEGANARGTSTSLPSGTRSNSRRAKSSFPASSPIPPMSWSIPNSSRSGCNAMRAGSAKRT